MNIAITSNIALPVKKYGGAERVIWDLCYELNALGHKVYLIAPPGSRCDFAQVVEYNFQNSSGSSMLPRGVDILHVNSRIKINSDIPNVTTIHGNAKHDEMLPVQSVFVSLNHALRHGSSSYVHNGLRFKNSGLESVRANFHFLGKAAWRRKNVKGAIKCVRKANCGKINILGGKRLNFNMGFRLTLDPVAHFHGMVDDCLKYKVMSKSKGLVFPVLWNEPFGLAIIESLFAGCPVFGTPYGSLPELVPSEVGFLSASSIELAEAMKESQQWKPQVCRDYAVANYNSKKMALKYVEIYERVLDGEVLNKEPPQLKEPEPKLLPFH